MTPNAHRIRTTTAVAALLAAVALAGPPTVSAATTPTVNGTPLALGAALPANNTIDLVANAGGGDDEITIATANLKSVTADGGAGDDVLTGNNDADHLIGGADDDRIVGARGGDDVDGGAGNDVLVWNNGDGSDTMDGDDGGGDEVEVNGAATQADQFTIKPNPANAARVRFDRLNLVAFNLNISAE